MNLSDDIRKTQRSFARKAQAAPHHQFQDLWHLLCRAEWIDAALTKVLINTGAKTAGIDGVTKATLETEPQRQAFIQQLREELRTGRYVPTPVRRTWIPKPGKAEKRPLGIPTIKDRVVQELLRLLLEPIWESDFLDCSQGFRPKRRTMDCIAECYSRIQPRIKCYWIIEGDIRKCFDRIDHQILLKLIRRRIADRRIVCLIELILKAGVLEASSFQETPQGSPQGGILSPLLANIYLHELDTWWWTHYGGLSRTEKTKRRQEHKGNCLLTRYADDFLLLCNGPHQEVEKLRNEMSDFLRTELHLELSEDKTRITHATDGFDFLGYHIRWETAANGKPWLRVTPTQKSVKRLKDTIRHMTRRAVGWEPVGEKIRAINRVLRGWANYYRHVSWSRTRDDLDWWVSQRMLLWLLERHKGMGKRDILTTYNIRQGKRKNWGVREAGNETFLHLLRDTKHSAYRKSNRGHPYLEEAESTFLEWQADTPHLQTWDGTASRAKADWWNIRNQVLERDARQCTECESIENLEVHHIKPSGGSTMDNLTTLCQNCHAKTATYGRNRQQKPTGKKSTTESRMR